MARSESALESTAMGPRDFRTTHWTVVLQARQHDTPESRAALEKLCRAYWYPLYAFVRRQGHSPHEAADLTQDFFSHLLATDALASVDPAKGKFRSFLLVSMKNLLANEWNRARAQKRGGGATLFSLDEEMAEGRYRLDPADESTPDKIFERRWAETILDRALTRLRQECDAGERARRFDEVKIFLLGTKAPSFAEAAARLEMSVVAVKGLVHRLRRRFRDLIRDEIAHTVSSQEEVEEEIRHLFAAFAS
jgi:RNA polymerase sigma-70 factor (ECF subfamily)